MQPPQSSLYCVEQLHIFGMLYIQSFRCKMCPAQHGPGKKIQSFPRHVLSPTFVSSYRAAPAAAVSTNSAASSLVMVEILETFCVPK